MNKAPIILAKLSALYKELINRLNTLANPSKVPNEMIEYYERYESLRYQLIDELPDLYSDLPERTFPDASREDYTFKRGPFETLVRDMEYIFEVKANSELKFNPWHEDLAPDSSQHAFSSATEEVRTGERFKTILKRI